MNRRELLGTAAIGIGGAILLTHEGDARADKAGDARAALLAALSDCTTRGLACAAHCQTELASGNKDFAHCATSVADMLATVAATQNLVARQSVSAKKLADACAAVCKECASACNEHKAHWAHNMHLECKACMEACTTCATACGNFSA